MPFALFFFFFFFRMYQVSFIYNHSSLYLWGDGIPVLSTLDGYYYLRLAEMIREGSYRAGAVDPLRNAPDNQSSPDDEEDEEELVRLPTPRPLLSVLLAGAAWIRGEPVDKAFLSFPLIPLLASLLAFPLFLLGRRLGGVFVGLGMALGGGMATEYIIRTDPLRLDTDALNPFFLFLIALLLLQSLQSRGRRSYLWLLATGLAVHLFDWWYRHPGLVVPFIGVYALALVLSRRPVRETILKTALLILVCHPLLVFEGVRNFLGMIWYVPGLVKEETGFIPRSVFAQSVSELKHLPPQVVFSLMATHPVLGYISLIGLAILFWRQRWQALLILPPLLLGALCFKGGRRFMIYFAPFVGMGLGVLIQVAGDILVRKVRQRALLPGIYAGLGALLFICTVAPERFDIRPGRIITPRVAEGFHYLKGHTPKESFVWAWWDYGYPIAKISKRAVYHDGGGWGNVKNLLVARSFVAREPEVIYNLVNGTTSLGEEGIRELLEEGLNPPEILMRIERGDYNRGLSRPVYLVFTGLDALKFYWISFFGTWDPAAQKGKHLSYVPLGACKLVPQREQVLCSRGVLDLKQKVFCYRGGRCLKVKELHLVDLGEGDSVAEQQVLSSPEGRGLVGYLFRKRGAVFGYLATPGCPQTAFHRMFFLGEYHPGFFELVYSDFPAIRIYRVKPQG